MDIYGDQSPVIFALSSLRHDYAELCDAIMERGSRVSPRDQPTREILNAVIFLESGLHGTFPTGIGRKVSPQVLSAELMQWMAGISDLRQLAEARDVFKNFSDDGDTLYGAYGPRSYLGLARAVEALQSDDMSRQASVSIWQNKERASRDLPCTLSWSFMIRDEQLHMTTYMRSNDVWWGVAYDIPAMCRIQSAVAWALGVEVGPYTHHAQSLHLYERDIEAVSELTAPEAAQTVAEQPPFFSVLPELNVSPVERWSYVTRMAHSAYRCEYDLPPQFGWYASHLRGLARNDAFCELCRYYHRQQPLFCAAGL